MTLFYKINYSNIELCTDYWVINIYIHNNIVEVSLFTNHLMKQMILEVYLYCLT